MKSTIYFLLFLFSFFHSNLRTQENKQINWLSFEQLEESLENDPKRVFVDFYADWCVYCKKMQKVAFRNPKVIALINQHFYAVKLDIESREVINFGGETFANKQAGKERQPKHEIALLFASRKDRPFSLPAIIFFDDEFRVTHRYFEYLSSKKMLEAITNEID